MEVEAMEVEAIEMDADRGVVDGGGRRWMLETHGGGGDVGRM